MMNEKLKSIRKAFFELNEEWKSLDCPQKEFDLSFKYPFKKSFDELTIDVNEWVESNLRDDKDDTTKEVML